MRPPPREETESERPAGAVVTERPLAPPAQPVLPSASGRAHFESMVIRATATAGVVGTSVALAAVLGSQNVAAWIIGLVISLASVILAGVLWSSRDV